MRNGAIRASFVDGGNVSVKLRLTATDNPNVKTWYDLTAVSQEARLVIRRPKSPDIMLLKWLFPEGFDRSREITLELRAIGDELAAKLSGQILGSVRDTRLTGGLPVAGASEIGTHITRLEILNLDAKNPRRRFDAADLEMLVCVAGTAAVALENGRLHDAALAEDRLKRDLEVAREVRRGFLPARRPDVAGYSFHAHYQAAYSVGGDYYGFVELPDGRLVIALGDVSGKGVSDAKGSKRCSAPAPASRPRPPVSVGPPAGLSCTPPACIVAPRHDDIASH